MDMMSADELLGQALRYKAYWGDKGGITVSGGEPLLQMDFLLELFTKAKENGVHTVLDTSGNPFSRHEPFFHKFNRLMEVTDLLQQRKYPGYGRISGRDPEACMDSPCSCAGAERL